ncbi:MAG: SDR family NAD(P)-dependent oxidoreductase [Magnetococcales bacterium]|nr:SDR family NAD(P)-dependent oxidoreductase [Magnetococcales bacterium]MBF0149093.1 SDR family NAD(P)-dependent oxidoreductase [Magnetococcales bacterium]MBF0172584.1 SDR family NAD(P)-dependent oxidoreductase [Magnetococcales bacterium]MBF0630227.1 SDR family NAD(P)-dependent oxidoreductase [Magnetococcales bacterium]
MAEEASKGFGLLLYNGFKVGLGLLVFLPFLLFLIPLWFVYRQSEVWAGRPAPKVPWKMIRPGRDRAGHIDTSMGSGDSDDRGERKVRIESPRQEPGRVHEPFMEKQMTTGVALVTGGGNRLGALICHDLAALGFVVALTYHRSETAASDLARQIEAKGGIAQSFVLDLNNPVHVSTLVGDVERRLGPVTLLVNNAGVFLEDTVHGGWEVMQQLFRVNLQGPLWLSMEVARAMKRSEVQGQIISICDLWGERPLAKHAAYSAAKSGMIMATRVLARDLAPDIRVNAIAPGAVLPPGDNHPGFQAMLARTPLAGQAGPDGVLHALRYLLGARFVTGEVLHVDGGRNLV